MHRNFQHKMPSSGRKIIFITTTSVFFILAGFATYKLIQESVHRSRNTHQPRIAQNLVKSNPRVDEILSLIQDSYVDSINTLNLKKNSIEDILKSLDPHSDYLSPQEVKNLNLSLGGSFGGIGVEYYILNDTLLITNVTPGGPAEKAGLKSGDKIISVGNFQVSGKKLNKADMTGRIKGKNGTSISLTILDAQKISKTIQIQRKNISVSSIESAYLLAPEIGYIKISNFGEDTDKDFNASLQRLKKSGMKKLVLDLRDNSGGYFDAAVSIADQFLSADELIVYTKGAHNPRSDYISSGDGQFKNGELVVLIDENTASASEIVAGAIKDQNRGVIIGRRSFGKGLVQEQFDFKDGAALNLTVARYYTPSGRSIQKPYKPGEKSKYEEDIDNRYKNGELTAKGVDSAKTAAGGIAPDIYVGINPDGLNPYYAKLVNSNIISNFTYEVMTKKYNRAKIKNITQFEIADEDFNQFIAFAKANGISPAKTSFISASKGLIKDNISQLLARFYYGENGYYVLSNSRDSSIKKAINVLKN